MTCDGGHGMELLITHVTAATCHQKPIWNRQTNDPADRCDGQGQRQARYMHIIIMNSCKRIERTRQMTACWTGE